MAAKTRGVVQKTENLLSRFRGAMVGAVVGDCLGAHFENAWNVSVKQVVDFFARLPTLTVNQSDSDSDSEQVPGESESSKKEQGSSPKGKKKFTHIFTDDTAMARSVAASLIEQNAVDARDLAKRFTDEYKREPLRGYGANVGQVFHALEEENFSDPHGPASRQFNGSGSYGNGGAMRIVPAALFGYNLDNSNLNSIVDAITHITHTHHDAVNGTRLQCAAVQAALHLDQEPATLNTTNVLDTLKNFASSIEITSNKPEEGSPPSKKRTQRNSQSDTPYCDKLQLIGEYLKSERDISRAEIEETLGNDVSALGSVPTAIYSFLRGSQPIDDVPVDNAFERTIIYAITLGGDTDTIATMAGAMAGAYYGLDSIPQHWRTTCEGVSEAEEAATKLHRAVFIKTNEQSSAEQSRDSTEKEEEKDNKD